MNERKLIREIGCKSTGKVVDYYGAILSDDVEPAREQLEAVQGMVDAEVGDFVFVVTVRFPKRKNKSHIFCRFTSAGKDCKYCKSKKKS